MQSIGAFGFCHLGSLKLLCACALFGSNASFKIALGVFQHIAQQLCVARGVVSFFVSIVLKCTCNLWIALTISLASHSQVHAYLATFAGEGVLAVLY